MRQQRELSMVPFCAFFEAALPDDIPNDALARWVVKIIEGAPEMRGMNCRVHAVGVGEEVFIAQEGP